MAEYSLSTYILDQSRKLYCSLWGDGIGTEK